MNRRNFTYWSSSLIGGTLLYPFGKATKSPRKFRICLNPYSIGVRINQQEILDAAIEYGYEAIIGVPSTLRDMSGAELSEYKDKMAANHITFGAGGLPVDFRKSEEIFRKDLNALPSLAEASSRAGLSGLSTWIMPTHNTLTYLENFQLHTRRLKEIANIMGHYGLRLGLEYVGPKTLMARDRFPFIGSMTEAKELISAIGEDNVGFVLDSFHWYCAGETVADLLTLDKKDIITCDLNDAKTGRTRDQQIDNERELPTISGEINLREFLLALVQIDYDGPVRAEPFNKELNELDDHPALQKTKEAMDSAMALLS